VSVDPSSVGSLLAGRETWAAERLAPLVGRRFGGESPCWACVREGLERLGVELPAAYLEARGVAVDLGELASARAAAPGDVLLFDARGEGERPHLALAVGRGMAIHTGDPSAAAALAPSRVVADPISGLIAFGRPRLLRALALLTPAERSAT